MAPMQATLNLVYSRATKTKIRWMNAHERRRRLVRQPQRKHSGYYRSDKSRHEPKNFCLRNSDRDRDAGRNRWRRNGERFCEWQVDLSLDRGVFPQLTAVQAVVEHAERLPCPGF